MRSAAHIEILEVNSLCNICYRTVLKAAGSQWTVLVLVAGYSRCGVECERWSDLVGSSKLYTLVLLLHTGERVVHKCAVVVVIERGALGHVPELGPETGNRAHEAAVVPHIAYVAREDACTFEVGDHVVLDAWRDVGVVVFRSACAIVHVSLDIVASVNLVDCASLNGIVDEAVALALAVGILRSASVAHFTIALECCRTYLSSIVEVEVTEVKHVLCPHASSNGVDVVVVAKAVAF